MTVNALDATNIEIYGGDDDVVMVAPIGTTAPVGIAEPTAAFQNVGWLSEDGISWDDATDKVTITAHQGGVEVIEVTTKATRTFKFQCLEETALVLGLRYPGFTPVQVGAEPVYGGEVPTPVTDRRVWIIDTYSISNPGHAATPRLSSAPTGFQTGWKPRWSFAWKSRLRVNSAVWPISPPIPIPAS